MSLKIMHTGDVHLGMKFNHYPEISNELEEARFKALENVVKTANQKKCNILAVAGDLFDKINIKESEILKTIDILDKFAGDVILILPGNHDYSDQLNQLWQKFKQHLRGRILILDQEKVYPLADFGLEAAVYPAPCDSRLSENNKLGWLKDSDKRDQYKFNIGLAHGALAGFSPDLNDSYFKMTKDELLSLEMDLWLLGHSHIPYPEFKSVKNHKIFNNGTPEPDGMDCSHPGYAWYIELADNKAISAERIITGNYHFSDLVFEVNSKSDLINAVGKIKADSPENKILRLKLKGKLSRDDFRDKDKYLTEIRDKCFYAQIDQKALNIKIDKELIADEFAVNSFPYQLLTELEDQDQALHLAYMMLKEVQK